MNYAIYYNLSEVNIENDDIQKKKWKSRAKKIIFFLVVRMN